MCILKFEKVSKQYPYVKDFLFFDVSFCVNKGQRVGLLAEKQCGKSSMVKIIAQLTKQTEGKVFINGKNNEEISLQNEGVGIIFDDFALIRGKSVAKNIVFPLKARKIKDAKQIALQQAQKFDLFDIKDTKIKKLDSLQKFKTALARLDSRKDLQLVVFDDIFANIQREQAIKYIDLFLRDRQVGILQTSSEIDHLCDCDVIYIVADGTVVFNGGFEDAKQYLQQSKCFDKFGINDDIKRILQQD